MLFRSQTLSVTMITMATDLFPRNEVGTVAGMAGTCANLGILIFTLILGQRVDQIGYNPVFVTLAVLVFRARPLLINVQGKVMPSLTAESLRVGLKQKNFMVRTAAQKGTGIQDIRIGGTIVPATKEGEMWVHYTRPAKERYIPAWQVFEGNAAKEKLEGHVVLIGTSAQGLMDLRFNPMGSIMPGVEAHAQALEQILTDTYLERPTWASAIEVLVLIIGGILVGVIALTIAVAAQFGRIAFDSLLQRDGPEHLRGRNFARFETRFQLVWVAGALIPVALLDVLTTREGYLALGVALAVAGATYVLSLRSLAAGSPPRAPDEDLDP